MNGGAYGLRGEPVPGGERSRPAIPSPAMGEGSQLELAMPTEVVGGRRQTMTGHRDWGLRQRVRGGRQGQGGRGGLSVFDDRQHVTGLPGQ
jgi:hypothetical protein